MSSAWIEERLHAAGFRALRHFESGTADGMFEATLDDERVLVTFSGRQSQPLEVVRAKLSFGASYLLPLYDVRELADEHSVLVERRGAGVAATELPPLSFVDLARVGAALVDGVASLHAHGRLATGLRAELLFVDGDPGQRALRGFTTRYDAFTRGVERGCVGWSPMYVPDTLSAEECRGRPATHASDAFRIAAVLVRLATGERPFVADPEKSAVDAIMAIIKGLRTDARVPGHLGELVERALSPEPDARPTLAALADALRIA